MAPLTRAEIDTYLPQVGNEWVVIEDRRLGRRFTFKNFKMAMGFVNKLADLAEAQGHHPDILIHDYNKVVVEFMTHAIGGLSENDFIMAAKVNELEGN